jgi:uncharacterized protein (TIGR02996 family)
MAQPLPGRPCARQTPSRHVTTEQALLDAIVANPDDDALRLVYADLLESRGDPGGELIQLHCRLRVSQDGRALIMARIDELVRQRVAALKTFARSAVFDFDRGFVTAMRGHFLNATLDAASVLALAPLIAVLNLTIHGQADRMQLARPASTVLLARAVDLTIRGLKIGNTKAARGPIGDLHALAAIPFTRLRRLQIVRLRLKPADVIAVLRSPHLATVESITITSRLSAAELHQIQPAIDELRARRPNLQIAVS